jgi:peptide/nickel transport system permease protein
MGRLTALDDDRSAEHRGGEKAPVVVPPPARRESFRAKVRRALHRPGGWSVAIGGTILAIFVVIAVFAGPLAPHDPLAQNLINKLKPPVWGDGGSATHLLGTDYLGRDILSRLIYGARVSLLVGVATAVGAAFIGVTSGVIGGYLGGWVDAMIQRVVVVFQAFPFILLAILLVAVTGAGTWKVIFILVLSRWPAFNRVARSEALSQRTREYVLAAEAMGSPKLRLMARHVLPAVAAPSIVVATFSISGAILGEAGLSFLGLGVPIATPTWGNMLADGRNFMYADPWLTIPPGVALFLIVIAANVMGDGIRDLTDPRLRNRAR